MKIILGSASKARAQVLREAGYQFSIVSAAIDEKQIRDPDAKKLALALAHAKADALIPRIDTPALLITSDQVVVCNNTIREKPESAAQARLYLKSYADYPAQTVTAVVVHNTETNKRVDGLDIATVTFQPIPIPDDTIEKLIQQGDVFHCAGGFQIEGDPLFQPHIQSIDGEIASIRGLPLTLTKQLLAKAQTK